MTLVELIKEKDNQFNVIAKESYAFIQGRI
jgi:hypothetical protein